MLDEEPEPEEEAFYQYLLDHQDEKENPEKPYKGNCQLKDKRKVSSEMISCDMIWRQKKILLFTAENEEDYKKANMSDWFCVYTMDGEDGARELISKLKE